MYNIQLHSVLAHLACTSDSGRGQNQLVNLLPRSEVKLEKTQTLMTLSYNAFKENGPAFWALSDQNSL